MSAFLTSMLVGYGICFAVVFVILCFDARIARRTVWESIAIWWRSYQRFCAEIAATLMPPKRTPTTPSELERAERDFLADRIDIEEFERRVANALTKPGAAA